jgi:hypothetical protein
MSDKTAPCGHPGEPVVGTYVRCLQGCAKDPRVHTTPIAKKRGEVGHVDYCGCKPCTLRRRARKVVFRTKKGVTAEVAWDGIAKEVSWMAPAVKDKLRHWRIVDEDGDTLADGMLDVEFSPGDALILNLDTMVPPKLVVHSIPPSVLWAKKQLRQAAKRANFDYPLNAYFQGSMADISSHQGRSTYEGIRMAALMVTGVAGVEVSSPVHGEVLVELTETDDLMDERAEYKLLNEMHHYLNHTVVPAGIALKTRLRTPHRLTWDAINKARMSLMQRWLNATDIQGQIDNDLRGKVQDLNVHVESTLGSDIGLVGLGPLPIGFEVRISYRHTPTGNCHFFRHRLRY